VKLRVDLRETSVGNIDAAVAEFGDSVHFLITAWQWAGWKSRFNKGEISRRFIVMVPDFLYYARLISTGQAKEIPRLPGSLFSLVRSGIRCVPTGIKELPHLARGEFWAGAEALLTYDLGLLDRKFSGQVVLHYNLSDFTWLFEKERFLSAFQRKAGGDSRWGLSTQQLSSALSCCSRWNFIPSLVIYTPGYSRPETLLIETAKSHQFVTTKWILDLTQWPQELLCSAEIHDMEREFDSEWLLSISAARALCTQIL
jgi:hypothetical protein